MAKKNDKTEDSQTEEQVFKPVYDPPVQEIPEDSLEQTSGAQSEPADDQQTSAGDDDTVEPESSEE